MCGSNQIVMHLEQHQIHQSLQGRNVRPIVQDIRFGIFDEPGCILPLKDDPQGLALFLVERALFPVQQVTVLMQESESLIQMPPFQRGPVVVFGSDVKFTGINAQR